MAGGNIQFQPAGGQQGPAEQAQAAQNRQSVQFTTQQPGSRQPLDPGAPTRSIRADEFDNAQLREIASEFGEAVTLINRGIRFQIDEKSEQIVTQVVDRETDEVIRQIPPQELLDIQQRLRDFIGMLLDQRG